MTDHDHDHEHDHEEMRLRTLRGDPERFPRFVEVVDQDTFMALAQVEHLSREVELAQSRWRAAVGRHMAAFEELWQRLHERHPHIDPPTAAGAAYMRWNDRVYYVSWDDEGPS